MRIILKCVVVIVACLLLGVSLLADSTADSNQPCLTSFFTKSLHYTGEGMRRWYEEEGGFMEITKIPFAAYGTPLTEEQFTNMAQKVTPEEFEQKKKEQGNIK